MHRSARWPVAARALLGCRRVRQRSADTRRPEGRVPPLDAARGALPEGQEVLRGRGQASSGSSPFTLAADNDNARQLVAGRGRALARRQGARHPADRQRRRRRLRRQGARAGRQGRRLRSRHQDGALDFYVAHDSFKVGVLQAEAAVKATGGKGNYVLLDGQSGHCVATEIARGYYRRAQAATSTRATCKIVVEKNHDSWSPEQALKTVEDAIAKTKGDIQAILANNSGMARGAVQAVQAGGLAKHIFIAGADADAANVNYVCEGKQSVEVLKDIKPLAEKAAEVASQLRAHRHGRRAGRAGKTPVAAVAVHLVDAENARALVIDSGFQSASALPACK